MFSKILMSSYISIKTAISLVDIAIINNPFIMKHEDLPHQFEKESTFIWSTFTLSNRNLFNLVKRSFLIPTIISIRKQE